MPLQFQLRFFRKYKCRFGIYVQTLWPFSILLGCECFQSNFNTFFGVSVFKASVSFLKCRALHSWYKKSQPNLSSKVGLPVRTWLVLHLMLRKMLSESHFHLHNAWIVFTFRESRFYFFWKKHLIIITISLNILSTPPHLSLSKIVNALMFSAPRCSRCCVRFSAFSFFSYLSTLSLSSLACFSVASSPFLEISGLGGDSFGTLLGPLILMIHTILVSPISSDCLLLRILLTMWSPEELADK